MAAKLGSTSFKTLYNNSIVQQGAQTRFTCRNDLRIERLQLLSQARWKLQQFKNVDRNRRFFCGPL